MKTIFLKLKKIWMRFARTLGRINTFLLLSLFYFLIIELVFIFHRFTKKRSNLASTWKTKRPWDPTIEWMSHLF